MMGTIQVDMLVPSILLEQPYLVLILTRYDFDLQIDGRVWNIKYFAHPVQLSPNSSKKWSGKADCFITEHF